MSTRDDRAGVRRAAAVLALAFLVGSSSARAIGQWESIGPPGRRGLVYPGDGRPPYDGGGHIGSVAVGGGRVHAATSDGFFLSRDAGRAWTFANDGAQSGDLLGVGKIVPDPVTPSTV